MGVRRDKAALSSGCKPHPATAPFGGPKAVLAYLSRYTHRVAISNSRLIGITNTRVTFKWKDYRATGCDRAKVMELCGILGDEVDQAAW
jgi:hypothetical protein